MKSTARIDPDEVFEDLSDFFVVSGVQQPDEFLQVQPSQPTRLESSVARVPKKPSQDQSDPLAVKKTEQPEVP